MSEERRPAGGRRRRKGTEPEEVPFEKALARLEEIVEILEAGDAPLEKSLGLFEEGVALSRRCNRRLDEAERRLEALVQKAGGDAVEPLEEEEFLTGGDPAGDGGA